MTRDFKETVEARAKRDPTFRGELRAAQLFSISTATDFFNKVKDDLAVLQEKIDDSGRGMNCILSSYHLHEWVWARWLKNKVPTRLRGTLVRTKSDFVGWLEKNCPNFLVLRDLANGTKHCSPVHSTDKVEGYGLGPYGIGPYGASYLLIDKGEGFPVEVRYLEADVMLKEIVDFWDQIFSELGIS